MVEHEKSNIENFKDPDGLIHHGMCTGNFKPVYTGTDYFTFYHNPCQEKEHSGHCIITAILIDHEGRVIFNLKCRDCGEEDALKTTSTMWGTGQDRDKLGMFHISPKLKKRVKHHGWDDI